MTDTDLSKYNLAELKGLNFEIEQEIKNRQQQDLKEARQQILTIAEKVGMPIEDLLTTSLGKKRDNRSVKVAPQYRNPEDGSQVWSGRGRQPRWVVSALSRGKSLTDLKI